MATHTIRNKSKSNPIVTLTPTFFAEVQKARSESIAYMLSYFSKAYKSLTGKVIHVDHEQELVLHAKFGCDARGMWTSQYSNIDRTAYLIKKSFEDGLYSQNTMQMDEVLKLCEEFYDMFDAYLSSRQK